MTDSDLRELDLWIAEHFMGWKPLEGEPPITVRDGKTFLDTTGYDLFKPSTDSSAFALVKREIERKGWEWSETCRNPTNRKKYYQFMVVLPSEKLPAPFDSFSSAKTILRDAESEELAGCLTVKAAVEGSNG